MPIGRSGDDAMEQAERFGLLRGGIGTTAPPWGRQDQAAEDFPGVPALAETLLKMEFALQESSTDLREFSETVLGDVGAAIQILRLAGQEYGAVIDRPFRVEDCISALGPQACFNAAARGSLVRGNRQYANAEIWAHSREVAQYFRMFAAHGASINSDHAYLAGLMHALGALPAVLGWARYGISGDPARLAMQMAERWHFPPFVSDFFGEVLMPGHSPEWANFITIAHHPAKESWAKCPLVPKPRLAFS